MTDIAESLEVKFGMLLKQVRKEKGMSQAKLAAALGYSRPAVVNIEQGRQGITLSLFLAFCRELTVEPMDMMELLVDPISYAPKSLPHKWAASFRKEKRRADELERTIRKIRRYLEDGH